MRKSVFKLVRVGAALVLLAWAAGNQGQLGLAQAGRLPVGTLGFGEINSVVFSPDGRYLAVGTEGRSSVQLIETSSWRVVRTFEGHTRQVRSVAFSPDGQLLASGSWKEIKLWEVTSGSEVRTLSGHSGWVYSVAFSPDGRLLASGSWDKTIKLWEVDTGNLVRTLRGHAYAVRSVAFSPDGRLLASASCGRRDSDGVCVEGEIKLWEVNTGNLVHTLSGGPAVVLVWISRFPSDSSNRVRNFVQLVPSVERCAVLDNVDLINKTGYYANNFEVVLDGSYTLVRYYTDPRHPAAFDVQRDGGVTVFRWRFRSDISPNTVVHLGLWVAECDLRVKAMLWTKDERIVGKVPASSVRPSAEGRVEIVNNLNEPIEVDEVQAAQVAQPLPLQALNGEELPKRLKDLGVELQRILPGVVWINPGQAVKVPIQIPGPGGCPPEPNDNFATASPISLPFFARCEINPDGESDFFRFYLDNYAKVNIDVDAAKIGSGLDAILILWDQWGHDIVYNDDYDGPDPFISIELKPGTYFIQVGPHGGHGSGFYELRVTVSH